MKIKVKDLLPNPYRNIEAYPIDRSKIEQLRNSIRETSFWDNILARPALGNGQYQIAYGHHRLVAIKEELGKDTTIDIPVRDLSDEDMLRIMANENMEQWSTDWRVIVETIRQTREFLLKNSKVAKDYGALQNVGSRAISRFLGQNWGEETVKRALRLMKDEQIQQIEIGPQERRTISWGVRTLSEVARIKDKKAKKEWLEQITKNEITQDEIEQITRFENEPTLSDHDKEIVRENILEGRIRGKEQIREQVEFIKVRKLQEGKKDDEEKRREQLKDFINKTDGLAVGLNNKLIVLVQQFREYPDTKKYLPPDETLKLQASLTDLLITIKELIDVTKRKTKVHKEALR